MSVLEMQIAAEGGQVEMVLSLSAGEEINVVYLVFSEAN